MRPVNPVGKRVWKHDRNLTDTACLRVIFRIICIFSVGS